MAVIKYIGKYVNAQDATICFDNIEIETAIKNIKEGAQKLEEAANRMRNAQAYYTKETFSINGETFDGKIERIYPTIWLMGLYPFWRSAS